MAGTATTADTYDVIYLARNEWGNEMMRLVAERWFRDNPECEFVLVHEHAGWYLGFRRDGSVWATANDQAVLRVLMPQPRGGYSGRSERRGAA